MPQKIHSTEYIPQHARPEQLEWLGRAAAPIGRDVVIGVGNIASTSDNKILPDPPEAEVSTRPSPEAIKLLETADIPPRHKADMLLVKLGLRPATVIPISEFYPLGGEPSTDADRKAAEYTSVAQSLGLSTDSLKYSYDFLDRYHRFGKDPARLPVLLKKIGMGDRPQWEHLNVIVGKNADAAQALKQAWQPENEDDRAKGMALGYPETAVESYANGAAVYNGRMSDSRANAFGGFALSSDSAKARAEEAIALSWADAIQQVSPVIYGQVMEGMQ